MSFCQHSSVDRIGEWVCKLEELTFSSRKDVIFLDLDHLHKSNLSKHNHNNSLNIIHELSSCVSKMDEMNGRVPDLEKSLHHELSKIKNLDKQLGIVLNYLSPNDTVLLFSDHGSPLWSNRYLQQVKIHSSSFLQPQRICK